MTDTSDNTPAFETDEVEANHAIEQGLGVGARELAAQREAGEKAFDEARHGRRLSLLGTRGRVKIMRDIPDDVGAPPRRWCRSTGRRRILRALRCVDELVDRVIHRARPVDEPAADLRPVVVAPARDQAPGPRGEVVDQPHVHPVAGVEHEVHSGVSIYFRDPDGARIELIADPLGEMYGEHVL